MHQQAELLNWPEPHEDYRTSGQSMARLDQVRDLLTLTLTLPTKKGRNNFYGGFLFVT